MVLGVLIGMGLVILVIAILLCDDKMESDSIHHCFFCSKEVGPKARRICTHCEEVHKC